VNAEPEPARERRSDARRNVAAILEAARTVLASDPTASMAAIAAAAGVHRATVHRHFAAREDLLVALHERALHECLEALTAAREGGGRLGDVLRRITVSFLEIGDRYRVPEWRPNFAPDVDEAEARRAVGEPVMQLFREGSAAGELRTDVDPHALAALWGGMVIGAGQVIATGARTPEDMGADILRLVLAPGGA
jgi:TetR/AcrR family transcriptional regulator, mexCD-oprJ operon repressor